MIIPSYLDKEEYLQMPILHRFLREKKIKLPTYKMEYIKKIEEYANENGEHEIEVKQWLQRILKEGSKDICYKKIYVNKNDLNVNSIETKIKEAFPNCPKKAILETKIPDKLELINYNIIQENDIIKKIEFDFVGKFRCGEINKQETTTTTIYPLFIDIYLDLGFIVSRGKAKSTMFYYKEGNPYLNTDDKVDTIKLAVEMIDRIILLLGLETESDSRISKNNNYKMLFRLYQEYSYTPANVVKKIDSQNSSIMKFIDEIFSSLNLDITNKEKAVLDARILVEKFISINGDNEEIFKKDRPAYLTKVSTDDEIEATRIDTSSNKLTPLQCTEAFFDGKKSVMKSQICKKIKLVFKRQNELYFSNNSPLTVQFGSKKNYNYIKFIQYAEEEDIQNVLQAVFKNY